MNVVLKIKNLMKITLSHKEAQEYRDFKQNADKFAILHKSGVFDLSHGKVEINCHNGKIQNIHIHRLTYRRTTNDDIIPV